MVELESVNLFKNLAPDELQTLRAFATEYSVAAGQKFFRAGDSSDGIYIIKNGLVEISAPVNGQQERVLSQLSNGEIFGETALLEQCPHPATATAVQETRLFFLPRNKILALLRSSPAFAFDTLQEVSRRLREFDRLHLHEVVQAERLAILGNFARGIIHDLRTPLTIIGISAELVCTADDPVEKRAEALERIRKQIHRINDMAGDILELTRNHPHSSQKLIDYSDFITGILPELRAEAGSKSVSIELENPPPQLKVTLDSRRMRRVFFNLILNATDILPDDGKIFFRFHADQKEIVTEIEDSGPGIAAQITGKLFEPFVTHGKSHGTGLGLSICKKIIENHGGKIWTRCESNCGAIFCFSLPLAK